jgi:hypothetical protein
VEATSARVSRLDPNDGTVLVLIKTHERERGKAKRKSRQFCASRIIVIRRNENQKKREGAQQTH